MVPISSKPTEAMGISADFKCKCGYEACGRWGIGMNPIYREQRIRLAPTLCKDCQELVNINDYEETFQCHKCKGFKVVLYSNHNLMKTVRKPRKEVRHRDVEVMDAVIFYSLPDDAPVDVVFYLCPRCNEFRMRIVEGGCWD